MNQPKHLIRGGFISALLFLILTLGAPSWAEVKCGATIGPNQKAKLTNNLECAGYNPALTLKGPRAVLTLGAHSVDCQETNATGITVLGSGATLKGGTVTRCSIGVFVAEGRDHTITKVKALLNREAGFVLEANGSHHQLSSNIAKKTGDPNEVVGVGFSIDSSHTALEDNSAIENGEFGFEGLGLRNTYKDNIAKRNAAGFRLITSDALIAKNLSSANRAYGFFIRGGLRTQVSGNLAKDNGRGFPIFRAGFFIQGEELQVLGNTAVRNLDPGFWFLNGTHITVQWNASLKNGTDGIRLSEEVTNNTLRGNIALGNKGKDLVDDNDQCDANDWKFNFFKTRNQDCIR